MLVQIICRVVRVNFQFSLQNDTFLEEGGYVASCKCLLLPLLSPLCLANLLFACHPLCYGLSYMSVWANSFVLCLGAAERIRPAGSRQLV